MKKLLIIFLIAFLSGCVNYRQVTNLQTDNSGKMFIHYWVKSGDLEESSITGQAGVFNKDSLKERFSSDFTQIESVEAYVDSSDTTINRKIRFTFKDLERLNELHSFESIHFSITENEEGNKVLTQSLPFTFFSVGTMLDTLEVEYVYYFPGSIISHNADSQSSNKLVWKIEPSDTSEVNKLMAVYEPYKLEKTPLWVYILAGAMLLIVLFYLFRKRK
jgi:hypothetical protein